MSEADRWKRLEGARGGWFSAAAADAETAATRRLVSESGLEPVRLHSLLNTPMTRARGSTKMNDAVSNPQFEQTFADLAYAHLKDRAPRLLDYLVGFPGDR